MRLTSLCNAIGLPTANPFPLLEGLLSVSNTETKINFGSDWMLLRKEVIQPQVPLRLPCYDFIPIINHTLGTFPPCGLYG